jgi:hypothetical protein
VIARLLVAITSYGLCLGAFGVIAFYLSEAGYRARGIGWFVLPLLLGELLRRRLLAGWLRSSTSPTKSGREKQSGVVTVETDQQIPTSPKDLLRKPTRWQLNRQALFDGRLEPNASPAHVLRLADPALPSFEYLVITVVLFMPPAPSDQAGRALLQRSLRELDSALERAAVPRGVPAGFADDSSVFERNWAMGAASVEHQQTLILESLKIVESAALGGGVARVLFSATRGGQDLVLDSRSLSRQVKSGHGRAGNS